MRDELWKRFLILSADPRRRDPGCLLRAALVRGLRGRALPGDAAPLEAALWTYEFTLPSTETAPLATSILPAPPLSQIPVSFSNWFSST